MDSINLKKLSAILGLSPSTVSKALRNSYEISHKTKERVLKVAKEHNYQPNIYASCLRQAKSKTMAVIVPEIANNFFVSSIDGIQSIARKKGYHVLIYLSRDNEVYEKELTLSISNGRVDGVLISLSKESNNLEHIKHLISKNIPVVFFDRVSTELNCSTVSTNDYESAYLGTEHLIHAGCKKIASCKVTDNLSIGEQRFKGFLDAMKKYNQKVSHSYIVECKDVYEEDYKKIKNILESKNPPDGLFTAIESSALIAYEIGIELGVKIPNDLKILTFSNLRTAGLLNPSLTTITQPAYDIGEKAAAELIKAIEKPKFFKPENIILKSKLNRRKSSE